MAPDDLAETLSGGRSLLTLRATMALWHQKRQQGQLEHGVITGVDQVCFVVRDFERSVAAMANVLGVGPFKCWEMRDPALFDTELNGAPAPFTMRLGVALVGGMQWEVIQPLEGNTLQRIHLERRYEGPQHVLVANAGRSFEQTVDHLAKLGYPMVQSGRLNSPLQVGALTIPAAPKLLAASLSTHFGYCDTHDALGTTIEVAKFPPGVSRPMGIRVGKPDFFRPEGSKDVTARLGNAVLDRVTKLGFLSRDSGASVKRWVELGVGPWLKMELSAADLGEVRFAGGGTDFRARVAWCLLGRTLLEIIEPVSGATPHQARLEAVGPGLHTIGVRSDTLEMPELVEHYRGLGLPVLLEGVLHGGYQFALLDASSTGAGWLELMQLDAERLWSELAKLPGVETLSAVER